MNNQAKLQIRLIMSFLSQLLFFIQQIQSIQGGY